MKKKVFFYFVIILFSVSWIFGLKKSYAKYQIRIESNPIVINTVDYSDINVSIISSVTNEDNTYNVTVSNPNNYDVNLKTLAVNSLNSEQSLSVIQYAIGTNEVVSNYTIPAKTGDTNSTITFKIKIETDSNIPNYTTTESSGNNVIPVDVSFETIKPYVKSYSAIEHSISDIIVSQIAPTITMESDSENTNNLNFNVNIENLQLENFPVDVKFYYKYSNDEEFELSGTKRFTSYSSTKSLTYNYPHIDGNNMNFKAVLVGNNETLDSVTVSIGNEPVYSILDSGILDCHKPGTVIIDENNIEIGHICTEKYWSEWNSETIQDVDSSVIDYDDVNNNFVITTNSENYPIKYYVFINNVFNKDGIITENNFDIDSALNTGDNVGIILELSDDTIYRRTITIE